MSTDLSDLSDRLMRTLRQEVRDLHAYAVQPSAGLVKVDVMENPFRLPEALQRELGERLGRVAINRYPAERTEDLRTALAAHARLPEGCSITLGNGSDELIAMLGTACGQADAVFMAPTPSFVMYGLLAALQGIGFVGVALTPEFELDEAALLAAIERHRPSVVYLAYPNNPSANLWDEGAIERIVAAVGRQGRGFVVMDEAYQPFASRDSMALLARHPHVLVMRTLSKFGIAGVRIGYLLGRHEVVDQIEKVRPPFNVSVLNAEAALFALEHADEYERQAAVICSERERLQQAIGGLPGAAPFPSDANMILVRVADPAAVFADMKRRGELIKNVSGLHPLLHGCIRITVGTPEENDLMVTALKASLQ